MDDEVFIAWLKEGMDISREQGRLLGRAEVFEALDSYEQVDRLISSTKAGQESITARVADWQARKPVVKP